MAKNPAPDVEAWGVERGYRGYDGQWRAVQQGSIDRILQAMGADSARPEEEEGYVWVFRGTDRPHINGSWKLILEDGKELIGEGPLPGDTPYGYHELFRDDDSEPIRVIIAPESCVRVQNRRWGWALQLYALRSEKSWGIGDLADLRNFGSMTAGLGAGMVVVNPLHAAMPGTPQDTSPYFPSSREFRNLLYLRLEEVDRAELPVVDLATIAGQAHALNADAQIDRDAVWRMKQDALELLWEHSDPPQEFEDFIHAEGEPLWLFAGYSAIAEMHGGNWQDWPEEFRHPANKETHAFLAEKADRVRFYQWIQWLLDIQLRRAGETIDLIQDLAIGVNPSGADAWIWQDAMALGVRVGAPPDEFNTRGQDWGLPPFDPWQLRRQRFEPFIRTVRSGLRHAGGLRIDHVMGLFRLYWIPEGAEASEGTYVRYPWKELLAIVALESHRANAYVVGEDLGTIEPFMRDELRAHNILSYRLLWFEDQPPSTYPEQALAAITTHDLPTVTGLFSGEDLKQQKQLGMAPNVESTEGMVKRVGAWLHMDPTTADEKVVVAATELLAQAPSVLVAATVEDSLGLTQRPNYPGTTDEYPNWSIALPVALEDLRKHGLFVATGEALREGGA